MLSRSFLYLIIFHFDTLLNILQNYVFENDLISTVGFVAIYLSDVESKSKSESAMPWITCVSLMDLSGLQMKDGHSLWLPRECMTFWKRRNVFFPIYYPSLHMTLLSIDSFSFIKNWDSMYKEYLRSLLPSLMPKFCVWFLCVCV